MPPLRQEAAGHPGHPLTPMGSAVPSPAPAPVQAAEGPGEWAALPSAISVHSPCCQTQEADDQPRGVRKDLQTTNLGSPHRRHCRPGLVATWMPRISQVPPVPMGAEGGPHSPTGFQFCNTHCTLGTGVPGIIRGAWSLSAVCFRLTCVPPDSSIEALTPNGTVSGDGILGR